MKKIDTIIGFELFEKRFPKLDGFYIKDGGYGLYRCKCGHFTKKPKKCNCQNVKDIKFVNFSGRNALTYESRLDGWFADKDSISLKELRSNVFEFKIEGLVFAIGYNKVEITEIKQQFEYNLFDNTVEIKDSSFSLLKGVNNVNIVDLKLLLNIIVKRFPNYKERAEALLFADKMMEKELLITEKSKLEKPIIDTTNYKPLEEYDHLTLFDIFIKNFTADRKDSIASRIREIEHLLGIDYMDFSNELYFDAIAATSDYKKEIYYQEFRSSFYSFKNEKNIFNPFLDEEINLETAHNIVKDKFFELKDYYMTYFPNSIGDIYEAFDDYILLDDQGIEFCIDMCIGENSANSFKSALNHYRKYSKKIFNLDLERSEYETLELFKRFIRQTIGILDRSPYTLFCQFEAFETWKINKNMPNATIRDYLDSVLETGLKENSPSAEKVDFFMELLDKDPLVALEVITYKGRLTKDYKAQLMKKICK